MRRVFKYLAAAVAAAAFAGGANAAVVTIDLTGTVANTGYSSFDIGATHYDRGFLSLSSFDPLNLPTVSQGDEIDLNIQLDAPFTVPAGQLLSTFVIGLRGIPFPAGNTATSGVISFDNGGAPFDFGSFVTTTNDQISVSNVVAANTPYTFDHIIAHYTLDTLSGTGQLNDGYMYYTLFSSAGAVPEPATWAMMLLGFGLIGAGMRSQRRLSAASA